MRGLVGLAVVVFVTAAAVTHAGIAYPASVAGVPTAPGGVQQVVSVQQVTAAMCVPELASPLAPATKVGQVLHVLSTSEPDEAKVLADVQGTLAVADAWIGSGLAALRGQEPPASARELETKAIAVQTAQLQTRQVIAQACAPCPGVAAGPVAVTGEGADLARSVAALHWQGQNLEIAVAVSLAESGGDPTETNRNTDAARSTDYGLWQINGHWHPEKLAGGDWRDPAANARMAKAVWDEAGGSWTPWTTYKNGAYLKHLQGSAPITRQASAVPAVMAAATPASVGCGLGEAAAGVQPAVLSQQAGGDKSVADLVAFIGWAESQGANASENAAIGDPPGGGHSSKGWHYKLDGSGAVDLNAGSGESDAEKRILAPIALEAKRLGFGVIFLRSRGDHDGHLHVDVGGHVELGNLAPYLAGSPA